MADPTQAVGPTVLAQCCTFATDISNFCLIFYVYAVIQSATGRDKLLLSRGRAGWLSLCMLETSEFPPARQARAAPRQASFSFPRSGPPGSFTTVEREFAADKRRFARIKQCEILRAKITLLLFAACVAGELARRMSREKTRASSPASRERQYHADHCSDPSAAIPSRWRSSFDALVRSLIKKTYVLTI